MNKFDEIVVKFIKNTVENKTDNDELLATLKDVALEQFTLGLLSASEHCDIEAWLDSQLLLRE